MLNFSGRARRAEYWWFFLFQLLIGVALQFGVTYYIVSVAETLPDFGSPEKARFWFSRNTEIFYDAGYAFAAYLVFIWVPNLAVTIRRLHDTNRSGFFILMPFLASVVSTVAAIFLVFMPPSGGIVALLVLCGLVPMIASIWFLVVLCLPGSHGNNRFGPDPVPNRKRKPPAHPAFAAPVEGPEREALESARRAEIKDYYRKNVLPTIQKA